MKDPDAQVLGFGLRKTLEYAAGGVVAYFGVLVVYADNLERGRESYARRAWSDASDSLSRADQAASLGGEDLELFAKAAYLRGSNISFVNADAGASTGSDWTWEAGITEEEDRLDDELHILFVEGGCLVPAGTEWSFARLP
jgi:hypothetical protein